MRDYNLDHDVIVVGTGPAGVSAAWPLVQAGLKVLILDAATGEDLIPPEGEYLSLRSNDSNQWNWIVGKDLRPLKQQGATSPKLRVPTLARTFDQFSELNQIDSNNFAALGSLAAGGLSNAWGAAAARFDMNELSSFPVRTEDFLASYEAVSRRIGLSGRSIDDLTGYYGVDNWADDALELGINCQRILSRYTALRKNGRNIGVQIGRARLAVLSKDKDARQGCNGSGLCLWGCSRRSIYSARYDLEDLRKHPNLDYVNAFVAQDLRQAGEAWSIRGTDRRLGKPVHYSAKSVVLAAGTIATTAIVLRTLGLFQQPIRLLSNPTAAFLLVLPDRIGSTASKGHNLAQLSLCARGVSKYGSIHSALFSATHIPAHEFVRHFPVSRPLAIQLWRLLAPAAVVGNCFLPSEHSNHVLTLQPDCRIRIQGGFNADIDPTLKELNRTIARAFRKLGAILLPGAFLAGAPGSDIHYAGTLPMKRDTNPTSTSADGELAGLSNVFVADAASFPTLPAKPHTLTIMANAHRIGKNLAQKLTSTRGAHGTTCD